MNATLSTYEPTSTITIGISDMCVSDNPNDMLVTYALGSCLGVTIYDPIARVGGIIHCQLPSSQIDVEKSQRLPYMFVDTGIPALFERAYELGAKKNRIVLKAAGCAQVVDDNGYFNIGQRNHALLRKILWKNSVLIHAEDTGGNKSRTLYLNIATGQVWVRSNRNTNPL